MKIPLLCTLLCGASVSSPAQTSIPYPPPLSSGSTLDVAAGDFSGNYRQGVLTVRASSNPGAPNSLVYFGDPAFLQAVSTLSANHPTAVVTLRRPVADRFLVSDASGVLLGHFVSGVGFSLQPILSGGWAGAQDLRVTPLHGDEFLLAAVQPGGPVRVVQINSETGAVRGQQVVNLGGATLLDLCWVDWTNDGSPELAMVGATGLAVFETDGTMIVSVPFTCTEASLDRVRGNDGSERLAALYRDGLWMLGTGNGSAILTAAPVDVSALPVPMSQARLRAVDIDRDGDDDLHIAHAASQNALLIDNASEAGPWFPSGTIPTKTYAFGESTSSPATGASLAVAHDFDSDGYIDVAHCVDAESALYLAFDLETQPPIGRTRPQLSVSLADESVVVGADYIRQDDWLVRVTLETPEAGVDAYLVSVWEQLSPEAAPAPEQPLTPKAFYSTVVSAPPTGQTTQLDMPVQSLVQPESPSGLWSDNRLLWVQIRSLKSNEELLATAEFIAVRIVTAPTGLPFHIPIGPYLNSKKKPGIDPIPLPSRPEYVGVVLVRPSTPPPFDDSPPLDG